MPGLSKQEHPSHESNCIDVLCAASACSTTDSAGLGLRTAASSSAPFSRYQTFSFGLPEGPPDGYHVSSRSLETEPRVRTFVAEALERKGYVEDTTSPELLVRFGLGIMREARVDPEKPHAEQYTLEQLGFDLYDTIAKTEIWHGSATLTVGPEGAKDQVLRAAVLATLGPFPERKGNVAASRGAPIADLHSVGSTRNP